MTPRNHRHGAAGDPLAVRLWAQYTIICIAIAFALTALSPVRAADFVVGVAGPMTGPLAGAGKQYLAGVNLAAETINASGGVNGDKLVIVSADDLATPEGARNAARQLIAKEVRVVIGHYNSTPTIAASEFYAGRNILTLAPSAIIATLMQRKSTNIIRLAPRQDGQMKAVVEYMLHNFGNTPVAVVHDTTKFSRALAEQAESLLTGAGNKPALSGELANDGKQIRKAANQLARAIAKSRITALYWTGSSGGAARLLLAMRNTNASAQFIGTEVLASREFAIRMSASTIAGVRMTLADEPAAHPDAKPVLEKLRASGVVAPGNPAIAAYAALQLVAQAAHTVAGNDPAHIGQALRSGKTFKTVAGPMSFDAKGDRRETLYHIYRWNIAEDGKAIYTRQ